MTYDVSTAPRSCYALQRVEHRARLRSLMRACVSRRAHLARVPRSEMGLIGSVRGAAQLSRSARRSALAGTAPRRYSADRRFGSGTRARAIREKMALRRLSRAFAERR